MGWRRTLGELVGYSGPEAELELSRDDETVGRRATVVHEGESYWSMEVDHSPDERYLVVYYEDEPVFCFEDRALQYVVDADSANDAVVANDGSVAVADWVSDSEFGGRLSVYDGDGEHRIAEVFDANLGPVAITADGRYAATSTFNPDCRTYVYDVVVKKRVLEHENRLGTKRALRFGELEDRVVLHLANSPSEGPLYTISLDGAVVGRSSRYADLVDATED